MSGISLAEVKEVFYLAPDSPSGLRWKIDRWSGEHNQFHCVVKDTCAGGYYGDYWRVMYDGVSLLVHRIILMLVHALENEDLPVVDHKDGNGADNSYGNLTISCPAHNSRNKKLGSLNKTGKLGVFIVNDRRRGTSAVRAQWYELDGTRVTRNFSVEKYGESKAFDLATTCRNENITRLNIEGACYSDRHGGVI